MTPNKTLKTTLVGIILLLCFKCISQAIVISGTSDNDVIGRTCRTPTGDLITIIERNPDWGSGDLYGTFSMDDGESWENLFPIIEEVGNQSTFSVVLVNDSLKLFYASNENGYYKIYSIQSADGVNWINKKQLDLGWSINQQYYGPMVIAEEDQSLTMVYIGWGGGAYISHCPNGENWDTEKTLVQSGAYRARICKSNGNYTIAYHRNIGGNYDIHLKTSFNRKNWSQEIDISSNGNSHDAYISNTPDGKYILYYAKHEPAAYNICKRESDNGIDWSEEVFITQDVVNNTQPSFFVESSVIYLTWTHAIDYDTNNDIYLQKFDYLTSSNEKEPLHGAKVFYESKSQRLIIRKLPKIQNMKIIISDISGKMVYTNTFRDTEEIVISDLALLNSGMYVVRLIGEKYRFSEKVMIVQ